MSNQINASYAATGRRKRAIARVIVSPGSGIIKVNDRTVEEYFPIDSVRQIIYQAFEAASLTGKCDVSVNVNGGGFRGQAGAILHGIARATSLISDEVRSALKAAGLLTRDSREKERKKYGQRGARARFQFSKR